MITPKAPCTIPMPVCSTLEVMSGRFFCSQSVTALMFCWLTIVGN